MVGQIQNVLCALLILCISFLDERVVLTQFISFFLQPYHIISLDYSGNRLKMTIQQQKESNNINVSLMHLWRCIQGMRKKNNETAIPFRDSKLTHLLMPDLCRFGLQTVSMIACVNPHADEYDETLSVLGNVDEITFTHHFSRLSQFHFIL